MFKKINIFFAVSTLLVGMFGISINNGYASDKNKINTSSIITDEERSFLTNLSNKFSLNDTQKIDALMTLYNIKNSQKELKNINDYKQIESQHISWWRNTDWFSSSINTYLSKENSNKYKLVIGNEYYTSANNRTWKWIDTLMGLIGADLNKGKTYHFLDAIDKPKLIAMIASQQTILTPYGEIDGLISGSIKNAFDRGIDLSQQNILHTLGGAGSDNGENGNGAISIPGAFAGSK